MQMFKGDIMLVDLGEGSGSEQSGTRPCLVVQNDIGNKYSTTTIICPITTQKKKFDKTHLSISGMREGSIAMFEQIRVVDKARVIKYIRTITDEEMAQANKLLLLTLGI